MVEAKIVVEDNSMFTGEHFELTGEKDVASTEMEAKIYGAMGEIGWNPMEKNSVVKGMRGIMELYPKFFGPGTDGWESWEKYVEKCDIEQKHNVGGPTFHANAEVTKAWVIREKGKEGAQPCLIEYHGGGAIAGDAEGGNPHMARFAV